MRRSGRPARLTAEGKNFVNDLLINDDELASRQIMILLQESLKLSISESTIGRVLREEMERVVTAPKYCQTIRDTNKEKRLEFAERVLASNDNFEDVPVIFTDESSVELSRHKRTCRRQKG